MKKCVKCGKEIVYGVNGCMLMDDCFDCGGRPKYYYSTATVRTTNWNELDAMEDRCVRDWDD